MTWQDVMDEIYSVEFEANLNVVSSSNAFFSALSEDPVVLDAYRRMRQSGDLCEDVLDRLSTLVSEDSDPRFENPNDTPLAVLLWLTAFAAPDSAEMAATWVDEVPQCWYAKKLARRMLWPPPSTTENYRLSDDMVVSPHNLSSETRFRVVTGRDVTAQLYTERIRLGSSTQISSWPTESGFVPIWAEELR